MFTLSENSVIDASELSSMARFINHSCDPNCEVTNYDDESLMISAKKHIRIGEELSFDYGYGGEIDCLCGSPKCVKFRDLENESL